MAEQQTNPTDERREHSVAVVATFATLIHAKERNELAKAANAQSELKRLGVVVRFPRQTEGVLPKGGGR